MIAWYMNLSQTCTSMCVRKDSGYRTSGRAGYAITMKNGLWASVDDGGFVEVINGCVYDYINDFEL